MSDSKAADFLALHRRLLDCYASIIPQEYKLMDIHMQKDFCFQERQRLEEVLARATAASG